MLFSERTTALGTVGLAAVAEAFGITSIGSVAIYAGSYALVTAAHYLEARRILGKDVPLIKRKQWSILPCATPIERKYELIIKALGAINSNPKPRFVRYAAN